ncbi:MAG: hypothetical protein U9N57_10855 [Pseudomonadota bacterium]|nr:hypothetical protein [Pseudomonadota bacterium]
MQSTLTTVLILGLLNTPISANAKDNRDVEKNNQNTVYDLVNTLNYTLNSVLKAERKPGIKEVSTIQKNKQIIVQVIHDPKICYSDMIDGIAQSASRVNGVSFQNSFTLDLIDSYCKTDLFYTIQGEGLNKEVIVQYEDLRGNYVAVHRISKQLCKI